MPTPQLGGPGFDFGACFPRETGTSLKNPPYPFTVEQLSGSSAETCPVWVILPVALLLRHGPQPHWSEHPILVYYKPFKSSAMWGVMINVLYDKCT